jgi:hypothetical protein
MRVKGKGVDICGFKELGKGKGDVLGIVVCNGEKAKGRVRGNLSEWLKLVGGGKRRRRGIG